MGKEIINNPQENIKTLETNLAFWIEHHIDEESGVKTEFVTAKLDLPLTDKYYPRESSGYTCSSRDGAKQHLINLIETIFSSQPWAVQTPAPGR